MVIVFYGNYAAAAYLLRLSLFRLQLDLRPYKP